MLRWNRNINRYDSYTVTIFTLRAEITFQCAVFSNLV